MARVIFKRRELRRGGWERNGSHRRTRHLQRNPGAKKVCCGARRPRREPNPGKGPSLTHQHMRAANTRGLPPTAPHPHALQRSLHQRLLNRRALFERSKPLLVRQAQLQWRSTREGRARKGRGDCKFQGKTKAKYCGARRSGREPPTAPALR